MNIHLSLTAAIVLFLASSCTPPSKPTSANTENAQLRPSDVEQLNGAVEAAGGLDAWQKWNEVSFLKHIKLFDSTGNLERDVEQRVVWQRNPDQLQISWTDSSDVRHALIYSNETIQKLENQTATEADKKQLFSTAMSATYVMSMPFKLLERGYEINYQGLDTLSTGVKVHVLQSKYGNDEKRDVWWHYYDARTFNQVGYKVQHLDHFSLVENTEMTEVGGIYWPLRRKSWRVDTLGEKIFLRASYTYSDYSVQ